ncbi:MAG: DUF1080 domain-containing protein [Prolixibacteraceae bacterium]|nr:DUF1080 domain-containing protein [Prolixibacteraceae bacterium]
MQCLTNSSVNNSLSLILIIMLFAGCGGRKTTVDNKDAELKNIEEGTVSLFDGKTLEGWEITNFGTQGPVTVSGGNIILGMGDGCTGINRSGSFPETGYEVSLDAKKISGNDFFCGMTFPVGDSWCSFIVGGWGGPVVGLSSIDSYDASENETTTLKKFEHDTWYNIKLRVTSQKIEAWIDDEKVVDFQTEGRELSIRPEVDLSKPFGICSWNTTAALRNIILKKSISGHSQ